MPSIPATKTLFLTTDERALFEKLPKKLKDDWNVHEEFGKYEDTAETKQIRFELLRLRGPEFKGIMEQAEHVGSEKMFQEFVNSVDLSFMSEDQLIDIFFMLGPDVLSALVAHGIERARESEDMEMTAAIAKFRHIVFDAYASISHT